MEDEKELQKTKEKTFSHRKYQVRGWVPFNEVINDYYHIDLITTQMQTLAELGFGFYIDTHHIILESLKGGSISLICSILFVGLKRGCVWLDTLRLELKDFYQSAMTTSIYLLFSPTFEY